MSAIEAIKTIRAETGLGLRESKDLYESLGSLDKVREHLSGALDSDPEIKIKSTELAWLRNSRQELINVLKHIDRDSNDEHTQILVAIGIHRSGGILTTDQRDRVKSAAQSEWYKRFFPDDFDASKL